MKNQNAAVIIWKKIREHILKQNWVLLYIVLDSEGSSPGRPRFKMMVSEDGSSYGSVGGGQMEYEIQQASKHFRRKATNGPHLFEKIHNQGGEKIQDGSICGGIQKIAAIFLGEKELKIIDKIIAVYNSGKGYLQISNAGFDFFDDTEMPRNVIFEAGSKNLWFYKENLPLIKSMYVVGGGHVGRAIARQMDLLGFRIAILDNRAELNLDDYTAFDITIADYENISEYIPEDKHHYVVIATAGHAFDHLVLEKLIMKNYAYLGMLGSRTKVNHIFDKLRASGISESRIERVRAPVGLPIQSRSPAEIAVSIAAEIIQLSNS